MNTLAEAGIEIIPLVFHLLGAKPHVIGYEYYDRVNS